MVAEPSRAYGGVPAAQRVAERRRRVLEAGLEIMGTEGGEALTVRGLAKVSGLAARYVYESFPDLDDLQIAVFDDIAGEALRRALDALEGAPRGDDEAERVARTRAVLVEMVDLLLKDRRIGRVLLLEAPSSSVLGPRVLAETSRFAGYLAAVATHGDPLVADAPPAELRLAAQFLIGGVGSAVAAVLQGEVQVERDRLVDVLVNLFTSADRSVSAHLRGIA